MHLHRCLITDRDHLLPIFRALPESARGTFHVPGHILTDPLLTRGRPNPGRPNPHLLNLIIVASYRDLRMVRPRPVILLEHGSGQNYKGITDGSYAGGVGRECVVLFLCPSSHVAGGNLSRYPDTQCEIIGSPYVDELVATPKLPRVSKPVIALTTHWDCRLLPETRTGFYEYQSAFRDLATDPRYTIIGHSHPRIWGVAEKFYRKVGIEPVENLSDVIARADLVLGDNTSVIPISAACGLKVAWYNASFYRRHVTHSQRFWSHTRHLPTARTPANLPDTIIEALSDYPLAHAARARMVDDCFGSIDGKSATRAVEAILSL